MNAPEFETVSSIEVAGIKDFGPVYICGCERQGENWLLCRYHQGFNDGLNLMLERQ